MKISSSLVAAAVLLAGSALPLTAAETDAATGRALTKRFADTIVGVELVVTMRVKVRDREQPPQERRIEINGTVISPSGLTVTSLAVVDPQSAFEAARSSNPGVELVSADFKEVKLRLADGTEIPARFVLKDSDLDLAFMAPETAAEREFAHVKLEDSAEGVLLNRYFQIARAPKTLQRVPLTRETQVVGIVEKPRKVYLMTDPSVGTPVFDAAGKVLGLSLNYFANGRAAAVILLPSADILDMAKQAAAAQAAPAPLPGLTPPAPAAPAAEPAAPPAKN